MQFCPILCEPRRLTRLLRHSVSTLALSFTTLIIISILISTSGMSQETRVIDTIIDTTLASPPALPDSVSPDTSGVTVQQEPVDTVPSNIAATGESAESTPTEAAPRAWFSSGRLNVLILISILIAAILYYIQYAKAGKNLYIRKLPGLEAVDEAVGRATEMGKKIYFIPGIQDMNDVQTIAGIAILGRVASLAAEYETWLEVPTSKSLVMITATETMREAYTKAGKPDSYQDAQVHFITDEQFAYAAALDGMIVREKPATILYMGAFYAESLILSEVGNTTGAIQIAGTAEATQLPFFVAACDYTLLGEELFAASAYLSKEPRQLGSLRGQDIGKAIFITAIVLGIIGETTGWYSLVPLFEAK